MRIVGEGVMLILLLIASAFNWILCFIHFFDANQTLALLHEIIAILFYLAALIKERT